MFRYILIVLLVGVTLTTAQQICPPANIVAPCTCSESPKKVIRCENIRGRYDIKAHFANFSSLIGSDVIFDTLEITQCSSIFEIPAGSIESLKFRALNFMMNDNLEYIHPDSFNATYEVTTQIDLWNNYLNNDAPYERDIFDWFSRFTNIESIWLPNNRISSIPANAFRPLTVLNDLYLGNNNIRTIGDNALANLPLLSKVYLTFNTLSNEGFSPNAFQGVSNLLDITVESNTLIDHLDEEKFKPLLDSAARVAVGARYCGSNGCSYTRLVCDQRADWLCQGPPRYRQVLYGFLCLGGVYNDVWSYCAANTTNGIYGGKKLSIK